MTFTPATLPAAPAVVLGEVVGERVLMMSEVKEDCEVGLAVVEVPEPLPVEVAVLEPVEVPVVEPVLEVLRVRIRCLRIRVIFGNRVRRKSVLGS